IHMFFTPFLLRCFKTFSRHYYNAKNHILKRKEKSMVTQQEFQNWFQKLYNENAVYLWGANGDIITKELTDSLYKTFASATYNRTYYTEKLNSGKGRIGADCSGAFCKISGYDTTAKGYYQRSINKGLIAALPRDKVCMVFNKNLTHIGAYVGNGITIEMKDSKTNVYKENLKTSRWYYYGIPDFVDYSGTIDEIKQQIAKDDVVTTDYQTWLNTQLKTMAPTNTATIAVDGSYGPKTKQQTVRVLQAIYNKYYGADIVVDGSYGPKTKAACPGYSVMKKTPEAFAKITYIIHVYLYAKCDYEMSGIISNSKVSSVYTTNTSAYVSNYQNSTRGLKVDGCAGPATLYAMFK
ncbi:MAG: peptidoglycan-binding protein, partial [Lactobacillus sp.]|nr:peptidoglycan-binding protein [Lactobacillus sp.]